MLDIAKSPKANVMPCLTYRDAPAAVEFLCRAFGFEKKMVVPGENNTIAHAELTLGNAMVMLGSTKDTDYGRLVKPPRDVGVSTPEHLPGGGGRRCAPRARQGAGAEIVIDLVTQDYGGRDYTCRDPEGHIWTFGTYDPWAEQK